MIGWPVWLCQIAAVRARMRCSDPDGDALDGAAAVLFEVELALEGVVDRLDELPDGLSSRGRAVVLLLAGRPQQP